ncbi:MAG: HlyD family efflux transporter periplasmic adaptor subunit [Phycisphaerales bacterium]|nr:HlyD family efflux transporter periplasmic adaptor subunit [Phycisphaerales bacterium]
MSLISESPGMIPGGGPKIDDRGRIPMPAYPWKVRILLPAGVVLGLLLALGWSTREALLPATEVRVVPVVLRPVVSAAPVNSSLETSQPGGAAGVVAQAAGWIEPDPYATAITALTDGVVREVLVLEGQPVRAGDIVARLIDEDAFLAFKRAEAELAARRAELTAAQRQWDHPVERRRSVATAEAMVEETRCELRKLEADIAVEQARVRELEDLVARLEQAVASRASGEQELAAARFKLEAQRATVRATEARGPVLQALLQQRVAEAEAASENARLRIEEWRALEAAKAAVAQAEIALSEADLRLRRTEVRSPCDGVIMSLLAEPGAKLLLGMDSPDSAYVARVYDPARLQVRVDVPLADAHKVGVGSPAEVSVDALPGRRLAGVVTRIVNEADVTKNTLQFKVRLLEVADGLKPQMLARVQFLPRPAGGGAGTQPSKASAVTSHMPFVPEALLRRDGGAAFVLVADRREGVAVRQRVEVTEHRVDGWVAVSSGVAAGDDLIAEPAGLKPGSRIRIVGEMDTASVGREGQ